MTTAANKSPMVPVMHEHQCLGFVLTRATGIAAASKGGAS
jgi:hypothetical protein